MRNDAHARALAEALARSARRIAGGRPPVAVLEAQLAGHTRDVTRDISRAESRQLIAAAEQRIEAPLTAMGQLVGAKIRGRW